MTVPLQKLWKQHVRFRFNTIQIDLMLNRAGIEPICLDPARARWDKTSRLIRRSESFGQSQQMSKGTPVAITPAVIHEAANKSTTLRQELAARTCNKTLRRDV
jgi:hypothetical protein